MVLHLARTRDGKILESYAILNMTPLQSFSGTIRNQNSLKEKWANIFSVTVPCANYDFQRVQGFSDTRSGFFVEQRTTFFTHTLPSRFLHRFIRKQWTLYEKWCFFNFQEDVLEDCLSLKEIRLSQFLLNFRAVKIQTWKFKTISTCFNGVYQAANCLFQRPFFPVFKLVCNSQ